MQEKRSACFNSPGKTLRRAPVSVGIENQWTSFGKHLVVTIKAKHTYTSDKQFFF